MEKPIDILKQYWGYDTFLPLQQSIIDSISAGRDTVALLPTGGGKSLTYQIPALMQDGICVVVTPLIALMKDQVDNLRRRGVKAVSIHSGMSRREIDITLDNCVYGDIKLLYVAPERLDTHIFKARVQRMNVSLLAVDEAHCISEWGYDFRPSYLKIAEIRQLLPDVPVIALTATATKIVLEDIINRLALKDQRVVCGSFARPNISYVVRDTEDKNGQMLRVANSVAGCGIVYVRTRKATEEVARFLQAAGLSADFYHAGLDHRLRHAKQDDWTRGRTRIMVSTNAFGMGIDKPDVRFVVHFDIPDSIEAYYQEAGRAGRDGRPSFAVLLYTRSDKMLSDKRISSEFPPIETVKAVYDALFNYLQIPVGGGKDIVQPFNIQDFASKFKFYSLTAYNAIKILQMNGYMVLTDDIQSSTRIMFAVGREELYKTQVERAELEGFIKIILRLYTGVFTEYVYIDEEFIAKASGYTVATVVESMKRLYELRVIKYIPRQNSPVLVLTEERLSADNLRISADSYWRRKEVSERRMEAMIGYAENSSRCRSLVLQNYFDEKTDTRCGKCDICRSDRSETDISAIKTQIIDSLNAKTMDIIELASSVKADHSIVAAAISELIDDNIIKQNPDGRVEKI